LILFAAARVGLFEQFGILTFAVGQLFFYSICLILTLRFTHYKIVTVRKLDAAGSYFDAKTKQILKELSFISFFKLVLQQFEKIVLVVHHSVQHSSIFSLVSNLGSIIVRFVFATL
jgi:hypothetical protein